MCLMTTCPQTCCFRFPGSDCQPSDTMLVHHQQQVPGCRRSGCLPQQPHTPPVATQTATVLATAAARATVPAVIAPSSGLLLMLAACRLMLAAAVLSAVVAAAGRCLTWAWVQTQTCLGRASAWMILGSTFQTQRHSPASCLMCPKTISVCLMPATTPIAATTTAGGASTAVVRPPTVSVSSLGGWVSATSSSSQCGVVHSSSDTVGWAQNAALRSCSSSSSSTSMVLLGVHRPARGRIGAAAAALVATTGAGGGAPGDMGCCPLQKRLMNAGN